MAQDSPVKTGRTPVPNSPSQVIQRPANDSLAGFPRRRLPASGDRAENSAITARPDGRQPEDGTERLKPYRWVKGGPSPNPGGRPKTLRITETLRALADMPLPDVLREPLEVIVGKLPKAMTFAEGMALNEFLAAFGKDTGFRLDVAQDIRRAAEGTETQKIEIVQPVERDGEALRKRILAGLVETTYKRGKLYGIEIPMLQQMASDAGVNLSEVMEGKEPAEDPGE